MSYLQKNRRAKYDPFVRLTEDTESSIQNMIKNNLKSKKNKRSKNINAGSNLEDKNEEVDMVALDDIKQEIN